MSNPPSTNDPRRLEQIVAYLDGELSPVEVSLVERQLAEDPDFRRELQSIERAWSALDVLPLTSVDDKFSQTTMELVVGAARQELVEKTRALPIQRRKSILSKVLLATAAAALGLLMVRLVRENPNRVLLADLPAIEYIDIYSQFRETDFLRKLHGELGDEIWVADLAAEDLAAEVEAFNTIATPTERRDWLAQLDEKDRAALRARYNRFLALSPQEQSRLRDLHESIVSASDSDQLRQTLLQYQVWLNVLPASQQFELREKSVDHRVAEIVNQQRREANNPWIELTPEEFRRLNRVIAAIRERLLKELPSPPRGQFQGPNHRERNPNLAQQVRRQVAENRDEWLPEILNSLAPETREKFEQLTPAQQQRQIVRWMMQTRNQDSRRGGDRIRWDEVSQQELERFFVEETDAATKERLLAQPRDKMEQQLKRLYFRGEFQPGEFSPEGRPMGPPPRGGFGPRRGFRGPEDRRGPGPPEDRPEFGPPDEPHDRGRPRRHREEEFNPA